MRSESIAGAFRASVNAPTRWAIYQRERFPLLQHAPLIAAFSGGTVLFSAQLRAPGTIPGAGSLVVAFACCLLFFFQLRVADEHKDAGEDARFRPYRPVPRGLVRLDELRALAIGAGAVQLALALLLSPALVVPLALVWAWIGLMTKEFWLREWLATRPVAVIATHMLVMPLIDLYASACDWLVAGTSVHPGLRWFLVASFFNGIVIEIGRKVRAPEHEEPGVLTYTAAWGRPRAIAVWLAAMIVTGSCAVLAGRELGIAMHVVPLLGAVWLGAALVGARFVHDPSPRRAAAVPALSGAWTVLMYLAIGLLPLVRGR